MRTVLLVAVLAFCAAIGWGLVTNREASVPEQHITYRPIQVAQDGYVSSQTCKACHPSQYEAWHGSFHRTMTQVATAETVRADFNGVRVADVYGRPMVLEDSFWSDGMVRVSGREYNGLIESPCFRNAAEEKRTLTCFSCHAMHKTPDDSRSIAEWAETFQVSASMNGNRACLQCHPTIQTNLTAHTRHQAESTGSDCYNCHMPYTSYGLLKALRSHQISSPTVAASVLGAPLRK